MTAVRAVMYFRDFCYLNSSSISKIITLTFMKSSRNKFTLLPAKLGNGCFCWFASAMLVPMWMGTKHGVSTLISINVSKTSFYFPDSGLYLLNGFEFDFDLF